MHGGGVLRRSPIDLFEPKSKFAAIELSLQYSHGVQPRPDRGDDRFAVTISYSRAQSDCAKRRRGEVAQPASLSPVDCSPFLLVFPVRRLGEQDRVDDSVAHARPGDWSILGVIDFECDGEGVWPSGNNVSHKSEAHACVSSGVMGPHQGVCAVRRQRTDAGLRYDSVHARADLFVGQPLLSPHIASCHASLETRRSGGGSPFPRKSPRFGRAWSLPRWSTVERVIEASRVGEPDLVLANDLHDAAPQLRRVISAKRHVFEKDLRRWFVGHKPSVVPATECRHFPRCSNLMVAT